MSKAALITGITGQGAVYLAEFLLNKGYVVHGVRRSGSSSNTDRIDHLYHGPADQERHFMLHHCDLTDSTNILRILQDCQPDEIYHLAAQSHAQVFHQKSEYTANVDGVGTLRLLEATRVLGIEKKVRFYQASTSELYGNMQETPQSELTPFHPRSPYAVAKLYAYWITVNYREALGMYACNGILFNHESPIRGEMFVTRKITRALARIKLGTKECLSLGNLDAERDWVHVKDYVEAQWLMLQQDGPDDYVIATGKAYSVRDFVNMTAKSLAIDLCWEGEGCDETGVDQGTGKCIVAVDSRYYRPTAADCFIGDPKKAKQKLGWVAKMAFADFVREMAVHELTLAKKDRQRLKGGPETTGHIG